MPKKQKQESQRKQSARFEKAVRDLVAAGELNLIDAEKALNNLMGEIKPSKGKDQV